MKEGFLRVHLSPTLNDELEQAWLKARELQSGLTKSQYVRDILERHFIRAACNEWDEDDEDNDEDEDFCIGVGDRLVGAFHCYIVKAPGKM